MAGHNLVIKVQSGNQVDQITLSPEAVEMLMPGTPQQSVEMAVQMIYANLVAQANGQKNKVMESWVDENITVQS